MVHGIFYLIKEKSLELKDAGIFSQNTLKYAHLRPHLII